MPTTDDATDILRSARKIDICDFPKLGKPSL